MSHSCDESYDVYEERDRTARKAHECDACDLPIRKGDRYTTIAIVFDGRAERVKRCARCQMMHEHLRTLAPGEMWPDERLNCGTLYRSEWDCDPPDWLTALAFWAPGDSLPALNPCTISASLERCRQYWRHMLTSAIQRRDHPGHCEVCS